MIDRCPVHEAEIEYDRKHGLTDAQEYAEYETQQNQYSYIYNQLISGKKVYTFAASYDLAEILAGKYKEFSELFDLDHDFMWEYKQGRLDKSLCVLIENEAHRLASVILG